MHKQVIDQIAQDIKFLAGTLLIMALVVGIVLGGVLMAVYSYA